MKTTSVKVRKEIVLCTECKKANEFLYLSDFSYGERLIVINNGTEYVYINLLDDTVYSSFENIVVDILKSYDKQVSKIELAAIINNIFGIACDELSGHLVEFDQTKRKCCYCSSKLFDSRLVEPESSLVVELPIITHENWRGLEEGDRINLVEKELKARQII